MSSTYAFEVGDKIYIDGRMFLVVGFRKMIGHPIEYCLRTFPGPDCSDQWATVPEINAWLDVDSEQST